MTDREPDRAMTNTDSEAFTMACRDIVTDIAILITAAVLFADIILMALS